MSPNPTRPSRAQRAIPVVAATAIVLLAGCATPRERIADRLAAEGVDARTAACLGRELDERLSVGQLRKLGAAVTPVAQRVKAAGRPVRVTDVAEAAARVNDGEIVAAVAASGLRCTVL